MLHPLIRSRRPVARVILTASLLAAAVPLACRSTAAVAADMPTKIAAASPPPYQWTGCYVGLNGGGGTIGSNFNATVGPGTYLDGPNAAEVTNDGTGSHNNSAWTGGGQIGCNWQSGTVVVGLEGDFDYFHADSSFFNNTNTLPDPPGVSFTVGQDARTNYLTTVRPRIGIAADRNFAYVTGGVAFTKVNYTESYIDANAPSATGSATASQFLTGWTAGAGWEYALTDHWLFRLEYLYASFPTTSAIGAITEPGVGTNTLHGSANLVMQSARADVNFKF